MLIFCLVGEKRLMKSEKDKEVKRNGMTGEC